jgi:hypothetical protein
MLIAVKIAGKQGIYFCQPLKIVNYAIEMTAVRFSTFIAKMGMVK